MAIQNWALLPLYKLPVQIVDGDRSAKYPKRDEFQTKGVVFLNSTNIVDNRLSLSECNRIPEEKYEAIRKGRTRHLDIVMTTRGSIGKVALVKQSILHRGLINAQMLLIRSDAKTVDPIFLFYVMCSGRFQGELLNFASGSAQPQIPITDLRQVSVPVPPLPTQRKIAAILSAYDNLIENNLRRIKILEEMAQNLYREWFVKFRFPGHQHARFTDSPLGRIPDGWEVGRLDDALILQRGFDLPTKNRQEGVVQIFASTGVVGNHNEAKVKAPGVVTGRSGSLGTVLFVDEDFWPLNTTLWVKQFKAVTPLYAYYLLSALKLEQFNSGVAVPTLNRNDVSGLHVVIPPSDILQQFDGHVFTMHRLMKNLKNRNSTLRRTRDLLLPRLISGEVDVSELDIAVPEEVAA